MYRTSLTVFLVLLFLPLMGQDGFNAGLKAGWTYAQFQDLNESVTRLSSEPKSYYHIGGYLDAGLTDDLWLGTELLFSVKGGNMFYIRPGSSGEDKVQVRLNYLSIPVLLKYKVGPILLVGGPGFNFQFDERVEDEDRTVSEIAEEVWDQDFELTAIGGLEVNLGRIRLGARYNYGLTDLIEFQTTDENGNNTGEESIGRNSSFDLFVGFSIF